MLKKQIEDQWGWKAAWGRWVLPGAAWGEGKGESGEVTKLLKIQQHISAWAAQFARPGAKWKREASYF